MQKEIKFSYAIMLICLSAFIISGSFYFSFFYYRNVKKNRLLDRSYYISSIIQTGPEKEALKTKYLAELLDISVDNPTNIYLFDEKKGEAKLLASPLIKNAKIKKIKPNTLYIDYSVRSPIALLGDYDNIAVDDEGYLFPIDPYINVRNIPKIYLDSEWFNTNKVWKLDLLEKKSKLAFSVLKMLLSSNFTDKFEVKEIDVSTAFSDSYGRREIVLKIEDKMIIKNKEDVLCIFPRILRLSSKDYLKQIGNYLNLREKIIDDYKRQIDSLNVENNEVRFLEKIFDFRISNLAFIDDV